MILRRFPGVPRRLARLASVASLASLVCLPLVQGSATAGDLTRGQALHDTFCVACHTAVVYERADRLADTYLEIRQQVDRWQGNARLRWSQQDIESVSEYLANRYYEVPH
jgi:mono/diheme cytochrome c family protein